MRFHSIIFTILLIPSCNPGTSTEVERVSRSESLKVGTATEGAAASAAVRRSGGNELQATAKVTAEEELLSTKKEAKRIIPEFLRVENGSDEFDVKQVQYGIGPNRYGEKVQLIGYLLRARDFSDTPFIVVLHGAQGLHMSAMLDTVSPILAYGYQVFLVNLYDKTPASIEDGISANKELSNRRTDVIAQITQATEYLVNHQGAKSMSIMGFGTGGDWAHELSRSMKGYFVSALSLYGSAQLMLDHLDSISVPQLLVLPASSDVKMLADASSYEERLLGKEPEIRTIILKDQKPGFFEADRKEYQKDVIPQTMRVLASFLKLYSE